MISFFLVVWVRSPWHCDVQLTKPFVLPEHHHEPRVEVDAELVGLLPHLEDRLGQHLLHPPDLRVLLLPLHLELKLHQVGSQLDERKWAQTCFSVTHLVELPDQLPVLRSLDKLLLKEKTFTLPILTSVVWKESFRTSASKASMNFLRWASKERTQRIRPAASGKFLMGMVNGVQCRIKTQSNCSELSESPKHLFNVKEQNWTALGTGRSPCHHLKWRTLWSCLPPLQDNKILQTTANDFKQLLWAEQKIQNIDKKWTGLVTGGSPCCLLKNFEILLTSFTGLPNSLSGS